MSKTDKLHTLLKLIKIKENFAAKQLAQANSIINRETNKLKQLENYQDEYIEDYRNIPNSKPQMSITDLKRHKNFVNNLSSVIGDQRVSLKQKRKILENKKNDWVMFHSRYKALKKYTKKIEDKIEKEKLLAEQKETDTLVNDMAFYIKNKNKEN